LIAAIEPAGANEEIFWSIPTAQEQYATIDEETGVLTAVSPGSVTVTATSYNGTAGAEVKGTYNVTVKTAGDYVWSWKPSDTYTLPTATGVGNVVDIDGQKVWIKSGAAAKETDGIRTGSGGVRLIVGSVLNSDTTSTASDPNGAFDFLSKPVKITLTFAEGTNDTGNFQLYINNNTTSNANSILGSSSRPISIKAPADNAEQTVTLTINAPAGQEGDYTLTSTDASLGTAFFMVRCDGNLSVLLKLITVEYLE
jgi:hypothetical protein